MPEWSRGIGGRLGSRLNPLYNADLADFCDHPAL